MYAAVSVYVTVCNESMTLQVTIVSDLKHPNIVALYGTVSSGLDFYIILGWFSVCGSASLHESSLCRTGRVLSV